MRPNRMLGCFRSLFSPRRVCCAGGVGVWLLGLLAGNAATGFAAQAPGSGTVKLEETGKEKGLISSVVESRRKQAEASTELDEPTKKRISELYAQALESLNRAADSARRAEAFKQEADNVQQRQREIQQRIDELRGQAPTLPEALTLPDMEQELARADRNLTDLKQAQSQAENELATRANRRKDVRGLLFSAPQRLQEIDGQLQSPTPADEPSLLTLARRTELEARRLAIEQEIPAYQNELAKYDAEDALDLVRLQRDWRIQEVAFAERQFQLLDSRVKQLRAAAAGEAVRQAEEEAVRAQPLLRDYAARNRELAEKAQTLTQQIGQTEHALRDAEALLESVQQEFQQAKEREQSVGLTKTVGAQLRKQEAALPDVRKYRQNIRTRQQTIEDVRYELFELEEERNALAQPELIVGRLLREAPAGLSPTERRELQNAAEAALSRKRTYLDAAIRNQSTYFDRLTELDTIELQLVNRTEKFIDYIRERVLWIRTSKPLTAEMSISGSDLWLVNPGQWLTLGRRISSDIWENPNWFVVAVLAFSGLFAVRRRLRWRVREIGESAERRNCTQFRLTLRAAAITLLISLLWPALTWYLAWRLTPGTTGADFVNAVATGLWVLAGAFFPVELLRQVCRPHGLAVSHFDWPSSTVELLRANLLRLMLVGMPLVFLTTVLHASDPERGYDAVERICFILVCGVVSRFLARVLHPDSGVLHEYVAFHAGGWIDRLKYVWYWLGVASPLALAAAAFFGYYYTARELGLRLLYTILLIALLVVIRAFLLRWLLVHRRHLSIRQARERRAAALAAAGPPSSEGAALSRPVIPVEETIDLAHLSSQTQRMVTALVVVAALAGTWGIWHNVVPALNILDRWRLWTTVVPMTETTTNAAGETEITTHDIVRQVTVVDLLAVSVIGFITIVAFRNLPGLLEITVLQRLPLEASVRYAVTTLSSYTIILAGVILGAGTLGLRWNQIQWLATALTFGLAFGLQEIFANFVAGLIILFERPVRVGDIVTVDDVTGVVSRVRIRATTITNWDRKEFVVPNKEFITGKVLNATLSDQVNRIVINVGVAYGSDTEQARNLLLRIAQGHPLLMKDPAPLATFEGFGDSALNLVLRAYMPTFENRLNVIHELHTAIHQEFKAAGLEIPFPQHDLHVRSIAPQCKLEFTQPAGNGVPE
ncbi:MAG TPA: mechanosensitive ion channel [Candidatus Anammoximicrobium sp.]|nr:mechanosensitive ion channel [Candidatus Anammoximicrobium sp.]